MTRRSIFVTVGTTRFDPLIDAVTRPEALQWMKHNGYTHLVIQYGKGHEPVLGEASPVIVRTFGFQPSLEQDMKDADMIISHAGAGTVMEALRYQKRLIVVINTALMDNHQTELAHAMAKRGHLFVVESPPELNDANTWNDFDGFVPIPYHGGDEHDFGRLLNQHLGIPNDGE